jgi:hypothetical protein
VSSVFYQGPFGDRELDVEFTTAGDVILHDPTGELDLEAEYAAVELGFRPPPWLEAFNNRTKRAVWFLIQRGMLIGPALKLWCLAMVEKAGREGDVGIEPFMGMIENARELAWLPAGASARAIRDAVSQEIALEELQGLATARQWDLLRMLLKATRFWADAADPEFTDAERYNVYEDMVHGLADLAVSRRWRRGRMDVAPLRKWMLGEAVRQITSQEALLKG